MAKAMVQRSGEKSWQGGDLRAMEFREMSRQFQDAAALCSEVFNGIEAHEKKCLLSGDLTDKYSVDLMALKAYPVELSVRLFLLADPESQESVPQWKQSIEEGKSKQIFDVITACSRGSKGKSIEIKNKIRTPGESNVSSVEFESEPRFEVQTERETCDGGKSISKQELQATKDQFMKLLASISKSVAMSIRNRSMTETVVTVPPRGSFKLGLLSWLFDEMWDDMDQLVSKVSQVLATCMLAPLSGQISALLLISADIEWLCTWVPCFAQKLQWINIDEQIEEEMEDGEDIEESMFASYISCWEQTRRRGYCCRFEDPTILSPMLFTHYRPGHAPFFSGVTRTMQIFSIKVTMIEGFEWPLEVYGVVAARDAVDYRRNLLFLRTRDDCQFLTENDSCLHLTGPSRAIMSNDTVTIELQLKVKGTTKSKDRALISRAFSCNGGHGDRFTTRSIDGYFCRIDLCSENLGQSIQATILSVRVKEGSLLSRSGVQVVCSALPEERDEDDRECTSRHVVLLDRKDGTVPVDEEGYLDLSRQVVSVKLEGRLEIRVKAFSQSGDISDCVVFTPETSNISLKTCVLGDCELEIIVAWSLLVDDQQSILMMSYTEPCTSAPFPFMKLDEDGHKTC